MSALVASWQADEILIVETELEKLFALQDRPLNKEKKLMLSQELSASGLPARLVIAGIKKLQVEDLKTVKLSTIVDAAKEYLDPMIANEIVECDHCFKSGYMIMVDDQKYQFSLRCVCRNGDRVQGLARWNGGYQQESRGRILTQKFKTVDILGDPVYPQDFPR